MQICVLFLFTLLHMGFKSNIWKFLVMYDSFRWKMLGIKMTLKMEENSLFMNYCMRFS